MENLLIITGLIFWTLVIVPILLGGLYCIWHFIVPLDFQIWIRNILFIPQVFWIKNPDKALDLMIELFSNKPKVNKSFSYKLIIKILQWRIKKEIKKNNN